MYSSDSKEGFIADSIKEGSTKEVEFKLDLEEWVGFEWNGDNFTSHGKKVEMDEHDTQIMSKQNSLSGVGKTCWGKEGS